MPRNSEVALGLKARRKKEEATFNTFGQRHITLSCLFPQLYIFRMIYLADGSGPTVFSQCVTHCSFPQWWHQAFYNFFTFGCLFIIPLLIMLICNAKIIFALTRVLHQDPRSTYSLDLRITVDKRNLNSNTYTEWSCFIDGGKQLAKVRSFDNSQSPP